MSNRVPYGASGRGLNLSSLLRDVVTAWRLVWDPNVPALLKLALPALALLYWISPLDLLPGLPFDDIAILLLAARMFVQLAPTASRMKHNSDGWGDAGGSESNRQGPRRDDDDAIDTTWRVIED